MAALMHNLLRLQVYRAVLRGVQVVAVKVFKPWDDKHGNSDAQSAAAAQARQEMLIKQEIAVLKTCHDRNIVQFLGACVTVSCPAFLAVFQPHMALCVYCLWQGAGCRALLQHSCCFM